MAGNRCPSTSSAWHAVSVDSAVEPMYGCVSLAQKHRQPQRRAKTQQGRTARMRSRLRAAFFGAMNVGPGQQDRAAPSSAYHAPALPKQAQELAASSDRASCQSAYANGQHSHTWQEDG